MAPRWRDGELVVDPHSAIGVAAARRALAASPETPVVALGTAHPAKFPDAVERATGVRPPLPAHLADLMDRRESDRRAAERRRRRGRLSAPDRASAGMSVQRSRRLPSGLAVVTDTMPHVKTAAVGVFVAVGSRHESATSTASRICSSTWRSRARAATAREIAEEIEAVGGDLNAGTGVERPAITPACSGATSASRSTSSPTS